jgi:GT2 family glycosyltransferase
MSQVTAVIPTLGVDIPRLHRTIKSIRRYSSMNDAEIVVVNNSSLPLATPLDVDRVLNPGLNLGYVGAIEWVRRRSDSEFLWVVQDDMTLSNDVLAHLTRQMTTNASAAVVSPLQVRNGVVPARTRGGVFIDDAKTQWENAPASDVALKDWKPIHDLAFVSGAGALFRTDALAKVGGFDVSLFPLMHVDVDTCFRLVQAGYRVELCADAHIEHEINGSTPGILSQVLDQANRSIISEKRTSRAERPVEHRDLVEPDIIQKVAEKASTLVLSVSTSAETVRQHAEQLRIENVALRSDRDTQLARNDALLAENEAIRGETQALRAERESLRQSVWWKATKPLRVVRRALLRRRPVTNTPEGR